MTTQPAFNYTDTMARLQEITARVETLKLIAMLKQDKATASADSSGALVGLDTQFTTECHQLVRCIMSMAYPDPTNPEKETEK